MPLRDSIFKIFFPGLFDGDTCRTAYLPTHSIGLGINPTSIPSSYHISTQSTRVVIAAMKVTKEFNDGSHLDAIHKAKQASCKLVDTCMSSKQKLDRTLSSLSFDRQQAIMRTINQVDHNNFMYIYL